MRPANCGITPEGWPFIGLCALVSLVMALLGWACLAIVFLVLFLFSLNFFRDPERVVPDGADIAVSPADGKIVCIDRRPDPFTGEMCQYVAIFMNVFNVHVNRVPVDCTIDGIRYFPGKFFNASLDKASTDNERCAYHLRDKAGNMWSMVQIAGLIARRIVCRVEQGDVLAKGQRMGMIRFGSRVDLYLPQGYVVTAGMGENVFAGESAIARRQTSSRTNE